MVASTMVNGQGKEPDVRPARLAVLGDVHLAFDAVDVRLLDAAGYDAILFVGDLAGYRQSGGLAVARIIATLRTPAFVIPGNHDAVTPAQLAAEVVESTAAVDALERVPFGEGQEARVAALAAALRGPRGTGAILGGYSHHRLEAPGIAPIDLVMGRPHSFGGARLSFAPYLSRAFGVRSLADSTAHLDALLGQCSAERTVVLAHNGPAGLGASRADPFGCDFRRGEGDHGDPDLAQALARARARGAPIAAVVAGHMHHALRGGGMRGWLGSRDGTLVVNAARVPRVRRDGGRHHVCLTIDGARAEATEVWLGV
jgi:uncharacterized protein (TIGR04168 family)